MRKKSILGYIKTKIFKANQIGLTEGADISKASLISNAELYGKIILKKGTKVVHGVCLVGGKKLTVGEHSIINGPGTKIICKINEISIGKYCSIARTVAIQEFNHNFKGMSTFFVARHRLKENNPLEGIYSNGAIIIENDVWIGTQSVILGGVKIHNGAIIAANSVVNKDIPPYAIAAGTPAKVIGFRFKEEVINRFQEIKWWNWDQAKLDKHRNLFLKKEISLEDLRNLDE